jgi:alpha-tubulin suppressor-like RCC1 family protein
VWSRRQPVGVTGGLTFSAIAAMSYGQFTCGLATSGAVYCWGANGFGQLGNGTTTNSNVPVKVAGQP